MSIKPPLHGSDNILLPDLSGKKNAPQVAYELIWRNKKNKMPLYLGNGAESSTFLLKPVNGSGPELILKVPCKTLKPGAIKKRTSFEKKVLSPLRKLDCFEAAKGTILTSTNAQDACNYWHDMIGSRVMVRVKGEIAAEFIEDGEAIEPELRLEFAQKFLEACFALWSKNLVHTDLKPGNVMLDLSNKDLQIIDLDGVIDPSSKTDNDWSLAAGTDSYLPPKSLCHLDKKQLDLYAAIATTLELLTIDGSSRASGLIKNNPNAAKKILGRDFPQLKFAEIVVEFCKLNPKEWEGIANKLLSVMKSSGVHVINIDDLLNENKVQKKTSVKSVSISPKPKAHGQIKKPIASSNAALSNTVSAHTTAQVQGAKKGIFVNITDWAKKKLGLNNSATCDNDDVTCSDDDINSNSNSNSNTNTNTKSVVTINVAQILAAKQKEYQERNKQIDVSEYFLED